MKFGGWLEELQRHVKIAHRLEDTSVFGDVEDALKVTQSLYLASQRLVSSLRAPNSDITMEMVSGAIERVKEAIKKAEAVAE